MLKRLEEMKKRVSPEHYDLIMLTQHTIEALDKIIEEHNRLNGHNAVAGISSEGKVERTFTEDYAQMRQTLYDNLEKTIQDLEHKGDKNWQKNFKDGVE